MAIRFLPHFAVASVLLSALPLSAAFTRESTLTVSGYTADATLTNFPLLVRISTARISGFSYADCQADGKDIAFTSSDGATTYAHEIDEWNTNGESLVWVRIPELTANLQFKLKYGDASISSAPEYTANGYVWKGAGYFGVYHMNETNNQGTTSYVANDSSSYGYDGQPFTGSKPHLSEMVSTNGVVGRARVHQTTGEWYANGIKFTGSEGYKAGSDFAVSGWFNMSTVNGSATWLAHRQTENADSGLQLFSENDTSIRVHMTSTKPKFAIDDVKRHWVHVALVFEGGKLRAYSNGAYKNEMDCTVTDPDCAYTLGMVVGAGSYPMMGSYDEFRLLDAAPGNAWFAAEYCCQATSGYVTAGAVTPITVTDTITVISSSGHQCAGVSPGWGVSTLTGGSVTCTAPEDVAVSDSAKYRFTGWKLRIVDSDGTVSETSGEGRTCTFTHETGKSAILEWQHNLYYLATITTADSSMGSASCEYQWSGDLTTNTITATANSGYEFRQWDSASIARYVDQQTNPYSFKVQGPITAAATFGTYRYHWKSPVSGNWNEASNWRDGSVPPNDGTADVVFPGTESGKAYRITLPTDSVILVNSLRVDSPYSMSNSHVELGSGELSIGAGGLAYDSTQYSCGFEFVNGIKITIRETQTWRITSAENNVNLYFNSCDVSVPEGVTWTIAGKSGIYLNTTLSGIKGTLRLNANFTHNAQFNLLSMISAPGAVEFFGDDTGEVGPTVVKYVSGNITSSNEMMVAACPIAFNMYSKMCEFHLQHSEYCSDNAWRLRVTSPLSGNFGDKRIVFSLGDSNHGTHFPFKQYAAIEADNSALVATNDGAVCFSTGLFVLKNANALGAGNALDVCFGQGEYSGYMAGILTTNGLDVAGDMELTSNNKHVELGLIEPGISTFSGAITGEKAQLHLVAPEGGTVNVTGAIDLGGANDRPVVVSGGGRVVLSGDNATKGLHVRWGEAVLAHANAAGSAAISLGGTVTCATTVRGFMDTSFDYLNGKWRYYGEIKATDGVYTIPNNYPLRFDGLAMTTGDRFAMTQLDGGYGEVYRMTSENTFVKVTDGITYGEGMRIKVTEGNTYGGRAVYLADGNSTGGAMIEDGVDPVATLLVKNGITVANDIEVTDNLSTNTSTIGVADDSAVTFSGKVTLGRTVVIDAGTNGTMRFTGSVVDAGETKQTIVLKGTGKVVLPDDINWEGRILDFSSIGFDRLDDASRGTYDRRILIKAKGLGAATTIKPSGYAGRWSYMVNDDEVVAVPVCDASVTVNVLGTLPVTNAAHRTLIAVPWCAMGVDGDAAIQISNIVKTANLSVGDTLHCVVSNGTYDTWQLASNATTHVLYWNRVQQVSDSDNQVYQSGDPSVSTASRGGSLILFRHSPTNSDGTAKAFYLFGQSATSASATVTVEKGASASAPAYTLIASPKPGEWSLNDDAEWESVGSDDYISIYRNNGLRTTLYWDSELGDGGKWYTPSNLYKTVKHPVFGDLKMQTGTVHAVYRDLIPAGQGVWYVSRGGQPTINWK